MSIFLVKSIRALVFLAAEVAAVLSMLSLMGIPQHKASPHTLRKLHGAMGLVFAVLLVATSILCAHYVARVGDHTHWFYTRFVCEGQQTMLSANMAGMGFGLPAAIACQLEEPGRQVIAIAGDGGFGMAGMEFTTAVHNELPLTVIVFNDGKLKNIMKEQIEEGFEEYRVSFPNPNFAEFAASAGGLGIRVEDPGDLEGSLRRALDSKQPAPVEVMVDPSEIMKRVRRA